MVLSLVFCPETIKTLCIEILKNAAIVWITSMFALFSFVSPRTFISSRFRHSLYPVGNEENEEPGITCTWSNTPLFET